jgi:hypothetical protein
MAVTWWATIRFGNGNTQRVVVVADNQFNAKAMVEAQYGASAVIISGPHRADLMHAR